PESGSGGSRRVWARHCEQCHDSLVLNAAGIGPCGSTFTRVICSRDGGTPSGTSPARTDLAAAEEVGRWPEPLGFSHRLDSAGNHFWRYDNGLSGPAVLMG